MRPLHAFLKKGAPRVASGWGEREQVCLDRLKAILASRPLLRQVNHEDGAGALVLQTDASKTGLGAVEKAPFKIVANIPYYISAKLIKQMIQYRDTLTSGVVMVQKEFAKDLKKLVASTLSKVIISAPTNRAGKANIAKTVAVKIPQTVKGILINVIPLVRACKTVIK